MKTLLIGILCISITGLSFAQNEIAYTDVKSETTGSFNSSQNNSEYLSFSKTNAISEHIIKLQKLVANYNISQQDIYDAKDPSVYTVEFTKAQNKLVVQYNQDGDIMKCNEKYKNVRLPYSISSQISKSNPGWAFSDNVFTVKYSKGEIVQSQYKVVLEKNNKRKVVTIN